MNYRSLNKMFNWMVVIGMLLFLVMSISIGWVYGWDVVTIDYINSPIFIALVIFASIGLIGDIVLGYKKLGSWEIVSEDEKNE